MLKEFLNSRTNYMEFCAFLRLAFCTLIVFSALTVLAQDESEELKVDSSIVVLNASIYDISGKHVSGLKQPQFKIFEDGIEQKIDFFTAEETPFAAVILLDTSGSMEERVTLARAAAIRFLDGLRVDDSAAIYRFDSKVALVQSFSNSRDVNEKVYELKAEGMTTMNDAVFEAAKQLESRPEKRRAIIVLSDGQDTFSGKSSGKALKAALAANAIIYTVDMSPVGAKDRILGQTALKNLSEKSGGIFVATPGGVAMREAFARIVEDLGVQYTLGYSPSNTKKDGKWRSIELRVARSNLTIRTRKGYHSAKEK